MCPRRFSINSHIARGRSTFIPPTQFRYAALLPSHIGIASSFATNTRNHRPTQHLNCAVQVVIALPRSCLVSQFNGVWSESSDYCESLGGNILRQTSAMLEKLFRSNNWQHNQPPQIREWVSKDFQQTKEVEALSDVVKFLASVCWGIRLNGIQLKLYLFFQLLSSLLARQRIEYQSYAQAPQNNF